MFTMVTESTRRTVSAFAAVAVVAFGGLVIDQGHNGALPRGTVEIGELVPVGLMQLATTELPEVVVTASRLDATELPEVVVTASRLDAGKPADVRVATSVAPLLPEIVVVASRAVLVASSALDPQG